MKTSKARKGGQPIGKLKRDKTILVRLTNEEMALIAEKMNVANINNRASYLRKMILDGYIVRLDLSELHEALRLVATATNNINQVAKHVNEARHVFVQDIQDLQVEVGHMRTQVADIVKATNKLKQKH